MKFKELVSDTDWESVANSLKSNYDVSDDSLDSHRDVYYKLINTDSCEDTNMRICIEWIPPDGDLVDDGFWDVFGRNGTLHKETEDVELFSNSSEEWLNSEVSYALEFNSWSKWLNMEVDSNTANNITLMKADIVAHCLWEMTFISYDEDEIQDNLEGLKNQVEEIKNMTDEERDGYKRFKSVDEMMDYIENLKDEDDEDD